MSIQTIIATMRTAAAHLGMADRGSEKMSLVNQEAAVRLRQAADDLATHLVADIERTMVPPLSGPRTVL